MAQHREPIDSRIERARTPSARLYLDSDVQQAIAERVLRPSWQWVGTDADLEGECAQAPFTLLPGSLNEPLVLTRDGDRRRCLSNVCTHRAMLICERPGSSRGLRCRYHGRRFGLDGRFASAPGFEGAEDFPGPTDDLAERPLERRAPLLFTRAAGAGGFDRWWGPVERALGFLGLEQAQHAPERDAEYVMACHWALYIENYLEGLHIPFIHPGLNATLQFEKYEQVLLERGTLQVAEAAAGEQAFESLPAGHDQFGRRIAALYFWLYPNLMVNAYPWGVSMNQVLPEGPQRTRVAFRSYVRHPELLGQGASGDLAQVEWEDEQAVEAVQRGLASSAYDRGRYSPQHEQGTHHFHRLLQADLGPEFPA